ncbi:phosphoribosylanthranilate isomerase [Singulisphaera sp. PoT]|uniref:phosphoribosylanthranilate isomerase n=1 Tax=Singulisphaera sp. PoT TaxID=3411797 RepID=UPI003BF602A2
MSGRPVRIKVCGLTRPEDVIACVESGVDWIGLNFHPKSPRGINRSLAATLLSHVPSTVQPVGLFVDRTPDDVAEMAAVLSLPIVQLHGNEPPEDLLALKHLRVIRAFRLGDVAAIEAMKTYLARCEELGCAPEFVLVDAHVQDLQGGTGHSIPDYLLSLLPRHTHLILAGGLKPENVAERVGFVRPWMVDVASGVESSPAIKDQARIREFVAAVRSVDPA